ncbi:YbaB/EbfC family nucleoid-associated protein [Streptomyces sp. NPDC004658]|uniref:YbaB/EbfC family nucleoid-associated protein n=1 Tax=Streptomyces sp. NPDC004658 TaxID=3154672 RepID=UPI00339F1582
MSGYEQEIERLLAEYNKEREEAEENRRRINALTATATSRRREVKVTVSARGEVTEVDFPTGAFRRMTPKELGELIRSTISEARAQALQQVDELPMGKMLFGLKPSELLTGNVDMNSILPSDPHTSDLVRDYLEHGFAGSDRLMED